MKNNFEKTTISQISHITMGQSPSSETYNDYEGLPFFQGNADFGEIYPKIRMYCTQPSKYAKKDDVLISVRAPIGAVNISNCDCCIGRGLASVRAIENISINKYLFYLLFSAKEKLNKQGTGSTFKAITKDVLFKLECYNYPFPTQHQIVSELDALSEIISKKKLQLEELDKLAQATFYDMFGDPVTNEKGLPILFWDKIFNTTTGKLNANAMCDDGIYPFFTCSKQEYRINDYAFDCEALLLAGNNATANYDVKHYKGKFNAYQRTYVLTLKNSEWEYSIFKFQLEDKLEHLQQHSIGANTKYLTLTILNKLSFILPPKQLQREFTQKIESIENQKALINQSIGDIQQLFDYTMDKYFN